MDSLFPQKQQCKAASERSSGYGSPLEKSFSLRPGVRGRQARRKCSQLILVLIVSHWPLCAVLMDSSRHVAGCAGLVNRDANEGTSLLSA